MTLSRLRHRFGGEGTVVTLSDDHAFTAAHCVAAVDGRRGTVLAGPDGHVWRMAKRWSPLGCDLALLHAEPSMHGRGVRSARPTVTLAGAAVLRVGTPVVFIGFDAGRFQRRRAVVRSVTSTHAIADVISAPGVRAGDSGGPVLVDGVLVGIVVARSGPPASSGDGARSLVLARLDSPLMRRRAASALRPRVAR